MNPYTLLAIITVGVSLLAFQNRDIMNKLILYPYVMVRENQWYRIITHAFIHADWAHLLFNMIALWSFGNFVYSQIGLFAGAESASIHFYIMYFGAIIFSSIADVIRQKDNPHYLSLGASGGVSAIIFCAILFDPWSPVIILFIPCPGIIFALIYVIYSSYMGKKGGDNINHHAHMYGAVFGLLYPLFINPEIYSTFIYNLLHPDFHGFFS